MIQRNISAKDNLENLARKNLELALEEEKIKTGNLTIVGFIKKKKQFLTVLNNNPFLMEIIKLPLLTNVHVFNYSPDKTITFMSQH